MRLLLNGSVNHGSMVIASPSYLALSDTVGDRGVLANCARKTPAIADDFIRLVIVEDDLGLLDSLTRIMAMQADITVAGSYACTEEAMENTDWQKVDVMLVDLSLPGVSGVDLIAAATFRNPRIHPLVHTVHDDRETLFAALRAGASGYVIKGTPAMETLQAVRAVFGGQTTLSPSVARFLIDEFRSQNATKPEEGLTAREIELLTLCAQGLIYKEIAERLSISSGTVHSHIKRIYRKLQVASRVQALSRARALGYLEMRAPLG
jgi:two-component system NarL family response regulator